MRLKRWESPRKEGRNDKGRGGSARKRQLKKQRQMLRQRLKEANKPENNKNNRAGEDKFIFPFFFEFLFHKKIKLRYFSIHRQNGICCNIGRLR